MRLAIKMASLESLPKIYVMKERPITVVLNFLKYQSNISLLDRSLNTLTSKGRRRGISQMSTIQVHCKSLFSKFVNERGIEDPQNPVKGASINKGGGQPKCPYHYIS